MHVVAEWLATSPQTALADYTQVTEKHYQQAAQKAAQPARADARPASRDGADELPDGERGREPAGIGGLGNYPDQESNLERLVRSEV